VRRFLSLASTASLLAVASGCAGGWSPYPGGGLPVSPNQGSANESANLPPLTQHLLRLTVLSDGCAVARTTTKHDPTGIGWSVRDQDGVEVLQRNAAEETRFRYPEPGRYAVVLTAWDGSGYTPRLEHRRDRLLTQMY
jgi:hypothetical protein